jgi:hypothetical protein
MICAISWMTMLLGCIDGDSAKKLAIAVYFCCLGHIFQALV